MRGSQTTQPGRGPVRSGSGSRGPEPKSCLRLFGFRDLGPVVTLSVHTMELPLVVVRVKSTQGPAPRLAQGKCQSHPKKNVLLTHESRKASWRRRHASRPLKGQQVLHRPR